MSLPSLQTFFKQPLPNHLSVEIICTLAALLVLEEFFADKEDEWQLIANKARAYLKSTNTQIKKELDSLTLLI